MTLDSWAVCNFRRMKPLLMVFPTHYNASHPKIPAKYETIYHCIRSSTANSRVKMGKLCRFERVSYWLFSLRWFDPLRIFKSPLTEMEIEPKMINPHFIFFLGLHRIVMWAHEFTARLDDCQFSKANGSESKRKQERARVRETETDCKLDKWNGSKSLFRTLIFQKGRHLNIFGWVFFLSKVSEFVYVMSTHSIYWANVKLCSQHNSTQYQIRFPLLSKLKS